MKTSLLILILVVLLLSTILAVILSLAKDSGRIKYKFSVVSWGVFRNVPSWLPGSCGVSGSHIWNQDKDSFVRAIAPTESVIYAWLWFRVEAKIINDYYFPLSYPDNGGTTLDLDKYQTDGTLADYEFECRQKTNLEENRKEIHLKSFQVIEGLIEQEELKSNLEDNEFRREMTEKYIETHCGNYSEKEKAHVRNAIQIGWELRQSR